MKIYKDILSRGLSLINHNPNSDNYGCGDRNYWHNQDGKGYSVDSFQVMSAGFALDYQINKNINSKQTSIILIDKFISKFNKKKLLEEYYFNQDSYCALTYNVFFSIISCKLLNDSIRIKKIKPILDKLNSKKITSAANQILATLCSNLLMQTKINKSLKNFLNQKPLEYNNLDSGYLLKIISIISWTHLALSLNNKKIPANLKRYLSKIIKIIYSIVVDYQISFDLNFRGNKHELLSGLKYFSYLGDEKCKFILRQIKNDKIYNNLVKISHVDDKYFAFFHFNNFILSSLYKKCNFLKKINLKKYFKKNNLKLSKYGIFINKFENFNIYINKYLSFQINKNKKLKLKKSFIFVEIKNKLYFFLINKIKKVENLKDKISFQIHGNLNLLKDRLFLNNIFFRSILAFGMKIFFIKYLVNKYSSFIIEPIQSRKNLGTLTFYLEKNSIKYNLNLLKLKKFKIKILNDHHPSNGHSSRFKLYK